MVTKLNSILMAAALCALSPIAAVGQTTWYVNAQSPGPGSGSSSAPYPSIAAAISSASSSDTIEVAPGTYAEHLNFSGKALTLVATTTNPAAHVLDGTNSGTVLTLTSGEGVGTRIEGFTIRNGQAQHGAGLNVANSGPITIARCVFNANSAQLTGGAVRMYEASGTFENCQFNANVAEAGGALYLNEASPTVRRCTFTNNSSRGPGGAVFTTSWADPRIEQCQFLDNLSPYLGAGFSSQVNSHPLIAGSLFARNNSATGAGGAMAFGKWSTVDLHHVTLTENSALFGAGVRTSGGALIRNSILWNNSPDEIDRSGGSNANVAYTTIAGGFSGAGNLSSDPQFVSSTASDFHLQLTSPAIDAGLASASILPQDIDGEPRLIRNAPDHGSDEANRLTLDLTKPSGPSSIQALSTAWAYPNSQYFSAYSLDPANTSAFEQGWFLGLHITEGDLLTQYAFAAPPFAGTTNAQGTATWSTAPVFLPPNTTITGLTIFYTPSPFAILGVTPLTQISF